MKGLKVFTKILGFISAYVAASGLFLYFFTLKSDISGEIPDETTKKILELIISQKQNILYISLGCLGAMLFFFLLSFWFGRLQYHGPKRKNNRGFKRTMFIIGLVTIGVGALLAFAIYQDILNDPMTYGLLPGAIALVGLIIFFIGIFTPRIDAPYAGEYAERLYEGRFVYFSYPEYEKPFNPDELIEIVRTLLNEGYEYSSSLEPKDSNCRSMHCFETTNSIRETTFRYKNLTKGKLEDLRPDFYRKNRFKFKPINSTDGEIKKVKKPFYAVLPFIDKARNITFEKGKDGEIIEYVKECRGEYALYLDDELLISTLNDKDYIKYYGSTTEVVKTEPVFKVLEKDGVTVYAGPGDSSPSYHQPYALLGSGLMHALIGYDYYPVRDKEHPTKFNNFKKDWSFGYKDVEGKYSMFFCYREAPAKEGLDIVLDKNLFQLFIMRYPERPNHGMIYITNRGYEVFKYSAFRNDDNGEAFAIFLKYKKRFWQPDGAEIDYDAPYNFFTEFEDAHFWEAVTNKKTYFNAVEEMWDRKPPKSIIDLLLNLNFMGLARDDHKPIDAEKQRYEKLIRKVFEIPKE